MNFTRSFPKLVNLLWSPLQVAASCDAYVCGGISPTVSYKEGMSDAVIREEFRTEIEIFVQKKADFILGEFFGDVKVSNGLLSVKWD